jgi:5-methylcytosine-specific restriction endonuclease McrA
MGRGFPYPWFIGGIMNKICTACKVEKDEQEFLFIPTISKYRAMCKECEYERKREYNRKHKLRAKTDDRVWWWYRIKSFNGDARKKGLEGKIDYKYVRTLYENHPYCFYCHISLTKEECVLDHVIPTSRGGQHHIKNIAISCNICNGFKGAKTGKEFRRFLYNYLSRFLRRDK